MSELRVEIRCLRCFRLLPAVFDDKTVNGTLIVQSIVCPDCIRFYSSSLINRRDDMKCTWEKK